MMRRTEVAKSSFFDARQSSPRLGYRGRSSTSIAGGAMKSLVSLTRLFTLLSSSVITTIASAGVVVSVAGSANTASNLVPVSYDSGPVSGNQFAEVTESRSVTDPVYFDESASSATAQANVFTQGPLSRGLHLATDSASTWDGGGNASGSSSWAVAQWGDTIRLAQGVPVQGHLAVRFSVHGTYAYQERGGTELGFHVGVANISYTTIEGSEVSALASIFANNLGFLPRAGDAADELISGTSSLSMARSNIYFDPNLNSRTEFGSDAGPASGLVQQEFGSGEFVNGVFGWQQIFYVPYSPELDAYNLNMFAFAHTSSFLDGSAGIAALNTITLDNVTFEDGSAIIGPITFDSGYTLTPVPEPSSLALFGTMGLGVLFRQWCKIAMSG